MKRCTFQHQKYLKKNANRGEKIIGTKHRIMASKNSRFDFTELFYVNLQCFLRNVVKSFEDFFVELIFVEKKSLKK